MAKKKPEPQQSQQLTLGCNKFILDSDLCDAFAVASIEMPKMLFSKAGPKSDLQRIKEKSNIAVCINWVTSPDQTSRILQAAHSGLARFKLIFLDNLGVQVLHWDFKETKVLAVDFGEIAYEQDGSDDHPFGTIKVEIEYESFEILQPKVK